MSSRFIIGIDEVGRGPLAGPVVVCALALPMKKRGVKNEKGVGEESKKIPPLRDSKKLTKIQREKWIEILKELKRQEKVEFEIALVSPAIIDKINIRNATNKAATMAFGKLLKKLPLGSDLTVQLDGGLYLTKYEKGSASWRMKNGKPETIVRGDEKIPAISLASIVAKVKRDEIMKKYAKLYPQYGFEKNCGYGTRFHISSIKKYGPCAIHRKSFLKNF